jgi:hypothetical protein
MDEPINENARAILLSCMDFRYPQAIINHMNGRGLNLRYYHVILAGASLGAVLDEPPPNHIKPHWRDTFFDHLDIVLAPPAIQEVHLLDHRDCKAYQIFRGLPVDVDPEVEQIAHFREMNKLKAIIQARHRNLTVYTGLLQSHRGEEEYTVLEME